MKFNRLIFFASVISLSAVQSNQTIYPFDGVDEFIIREMKLSSLKKLHPQLEIRKYWDERMFPGLVGHGRRVVHFDSLGLVFSFTKARRYMPYTLVDVLIDSTFKGTTIDGVGIGSSYQEVIKSFGRMRILGEGNASFLFYIASRENRASGVGSITFTCFNSLADTNDFVVQRILIE